MRIFSACIAKALCSISWEVFLGESGLLWRACLVVLGFRAQIGNRTQSKTGVWRP